MVTCRLKGDSLHPYGFGWSLRPINGHKAVSHTGSWQGFNSCIVRYLDDRLTIMILANSNRVHPGRIAQAVAGMYVPGLAEREVSTPIPDREPQFTAVVYNLFRKPDTMDVNPELFTKEYQPKVRALLRVMLDHLNSIGPVVSVEMVGYDNIADGTITQYRIHSKAGSSIATITRTKAGQIAGIVIGME